MIKNKSHNSSPAEQQPLISRRNSSSSSSINSSSASATAETEPPSPSPANIQQQQNRKTFCNSKTLLLLIITILSLVIILLVTFIGGLYYFGINTSSIGKTGESAAQIEDIKISSISESGIALCFNLTLNDRPFPSSMPKLNMTVVKSEWRVFGHHTSSDSLHNSKKPDLHIANLQLTGEITVSPDNINENGEFEFRDLPLRVYDLNAEGLAEYLSKFASSVPININPDSPPIPMPGRFSLPVKPDPSIFVKFRNNFYFVGSNDDRRGMDGEIPAYDTDLEIVDLKLFGRTSVRLFNKMVVPLPPVTMHEHVNLTTQLRQHLNISNINPQIQDIDIMKKSAIVKFDSPLDFRLWIGGGGGGDGEKDKLNDISVGFDIGYVRKDGEDAGRIMRLVIDKVQVNGTHGSLRVTLARPIGGEQTGGGILSDMKMWADFVKMILSGDIARVSSIVYLDQFVFYQPENVGWLKRFGDHLDLRFNVNGLEEDDDNGSNH